MIKDFLVLIEKMQEKQQTPTQNVQRVKAEPRDEGPSVKVITCRGMATGGAEEKAAAEPIIQKIAIKKESLDLQKENKPSSKLAKTLPRMRHLLPRLQQT